MTKYYLFDSSRFFIGTRDFPNGISPANGTTIAPIGNENHWTGNAWEFFAQPNVAERVISKVDFMDRWEAHAPGKMVALIDAKKTNAQLDYLWERAFAGAMIELDHPVTVGGMTALVQAGILTETERDEILS